MAMEALFARKFAERAERGLVSTCATHAEKGCTQMINLESARKAKIRSPEYLLHQLAQTMTPERHNRNGFAFDTKLPGPLIEAIQSYLESQVSQWSVT